MAKKGDILIDNALELILAFIGILLIAVAVYFIYKATVNQDAENAQSLANVLEAKINAIPDETSARFLGRGVKSWSLQGWNRNNNAKPDKCFTNSCFCICDGLKKCQGQNGFCRTFDVDILSVLDLPVTTDVQIPNQGGGRPSFSTERITSYPSVINFDSNNLVEFEVTKTKSEGGKITLTRTR